jgi:hypothetical protein
MTAWNKDTVIALLATNDRAIGRALIQLKNRQTADERSAEHTKYLNGRGFKPCHARMGTSMALFFERNGYLSPKQVAYWRKVEATGNTRIGCYWRQLLECIEEQTNMKAAA